jgi:AraC-like DNA-binding protein
VARHLTADGVYLDIPQKARRTQEELIQNLNGFFANHAHRYELVGEVVQGQNTIAFQYRILSRGDGSGNVYNGAEFMAISGDAAVTITDYYDVPSSDQSGRPGRSRTENTRRRKYAKSGLSKQQMLSYKSRLEDVMQLEQLFLHPDLTLPRLATAVQCSVNHLSQVINSGFGMSFFDYVNQYRVRQAMALLGKAGQQSNVILNVAFAVGFNSNSAFYAAFKKCAGQTPAQYRNQQLAKLH